jgi:2-oxoglutarate ferredoxin oxidoreductase subunit beta
MPIVFEKTRGLTDRETHYCPGGVPTGSSTALLAEVLDEMISSIVDDRRSSRRVFSSRLRVLQLRHARGGSWSRPGGSNRYQTRPSDRDRFRLSGRRGSRVDRDCRDRARRTSWRKDHSDFVNNAIYGMTGGQMAPTTLIGQKTTTSPFGREKSHAGNPIRISEMLATIDGAAFIERTSVHSPRRFERRRRRSRMHSPSSARTWVQHG